MNPWLFAAAVNGFLSVAAGAFAAHGLAGHLSPQSLSWFETGARYHAYHALALLAISWLANQAAPRKRLALKLAGGSFILGIALFSGSLYLMAVTGWRALGLITPLGGLSFLVGWAALAVLALRAD